MGRLGDLFAPSDVGYPGLPGTVAAGNNGGSYSPPANTGFFNQFFAPTDLPYPLPAYINTLGQPGIVAGGPTTPSAPVTQPAPMAAPSSTPVAAPAAPSAPTVTPTPAPTTPTSAPAPSTPAAPASASPVTVIVQTACPANVPAASDGGTATTSTSKPAASGNGGPPSDMPVGNCPVPPTEQIVTAFATNPRLRARRARTEEVIADEALDAKIALRMLSKDGAPVAFVVPDGCDAVDFTFGAIEANPGHANAQDLDEVVTVGTAVVSGTDCGPLTPGDQIAVVIPWRYGSWVELAADHLRLPIFARFYQIETA